MMTGPPSVLLGDVYYYIYIILYYAILQVTSTVLHMQAPAV